MRLFLLFSMLFCAFLAEAYQTEVRPCQTPSWEGRATVYDRARGMRTEFWISYDKTYRRKKVLMESYTPSKESVEMILLYDQNSYFKINHQTKECVTLTRPPVSWHYLQIPPTATFQSHSWYGSGKNGVLTSKWASSVYTEDILYTVPVKWIGIYTVPDCVPFRQIIAPDIRNAVITSFRNVTVGIKDSSVFDPPSYCNELKSD